jgi:hypothetical protein
MHDNENNNLLKVIHQNIVGLKMILAKCARKYSDPRVGQRKKASYLRMAKDCSKIIEEADNFLKQNNYNGN